MPKFKNSLEFTHDKPNRIGVLLVNLGTPAAPTATAIRHYLKTFLQDPRVIEIPKCLWWFILRLLVLPFRPRKLIENYQAIWTETGSPLLSLSNSLISKLKNRYNAHHLHDSIRIELGLRYGNPSIPDALKRLYQDNCQKLLVLPMYPQYSATTTGSAFDALADFMKSERYIPEIKFINHYCDEPHYITTIARSITQYIEQAGMPDKFIFSFHGLPERNLTLGDPYHCQCHKTARLIAEQAKLELDAWQVTFQSRFGKAEWLKPYTDKTLATLPQAGKTHVALVCPGFPIDCLETLEEIKVLNKSIFLNAGGKRFDYIAALNDSNEHVEMLYHFLNREIEHWASPNLNCKQILQDRADRAQKMKTQPLTT